MYNPLFNNPQNRQLPSTIAQLLARNSKKNRLSQKPNQNLTRPQKRL
jgi:hypothetical protein